MSQQWTVLDVARHLDVAEVTVRAYLAREQMPEPDGRLGRTPWWYESTIRGWRAHPVARRERKMQKFTNHQEAVEYVSAMLGDEAGDYDAAAIAEAVEYADRDIFWGIAEQHRAGATYTAEELIATPGALGNIEGDWSDEQVTEEARALMEHWAQHGPDSAPVHYACTVEDVAALMIERRDDMR